MRTFVASHILSRLSTLLTDIKRQNVSFIGRISWNCVGLKYERKQSGEGTMTLLNLPNSDGGWVYIWRFTVFRSSAVKPTNGRLWFEAISSAFSSQRWLCWLPSSLPPIRQMQHTWKAMRHGMLTEPMRQGKCFWACIHLWASLIMQFILCLTWHVCVVTNWSGNTSDFAPLNLEKNRNWAQLVPLWPRAVAPKGATMCLRLQTRRAGVWNLNRQEKKS